MRYIIFSLGVLAATPAVAGNFNVPGTSHHGRAFWLNDRGWHDPQAHPPKEVRARFTTTYIDGLVSRFRIGGEGHVNLFERKLGGSDVGMPALTGTINDGAAKVSLTWHLGG
ncbi:MAG TPA: hypothetical protein VG819_03720 [Rhizomicrobium sp.]|jgi:hypothetical protein|nr:hypothetical protein [Rhizomicrobium sp.]